uniref:Ribonucleotide reductase n=1 Tax=uncultured marine virus TaxID=186617 RepID=A0A0F7LC09_9VIRU|nr:ribonucleotide reductase [uncultured marine virus]
MCPLIRTWGKSHAESMTSSKSIPKMQNADATSSSCRPCTGIAPMAIVVALVLVPSVLWEYWLNALMETTGHS